VRQLGIDTVDIPVKPLDDATMLKMMANENKSDWFDTVAGTNEVIFAAKKFLDDCIGESETLAEFTKAQPSLGKVVIDWRENEFQKARINGVGTDTIALLLGEGWSLKTIRPAFNTVEEDSVRLHAARLRGREERARAKAEAAELEAIQAEREQREAQARAEKAEADKKAADAAKALAAYAADLRIL
jgi:hypothetical protein